jgi:hypothetical protein
MRILGSTYIPHNPLEKILAVLKKTPKESMNAWPMRYVQIRAKTERDKHRCDVDPTASSILMMPERA